MTEVCYKCLEELRQNKNPTLDDYREVGIDPTQDFSFYKPGDLCAWHRREQDLPGNEIDRAFAGAKNTQSGPF